MIDRRRRLRSGWVWTLGALAACSLLTPRPDPSRFFTLTPIAESGDTSAPLRGRVLGLGPITLPQYLDRPELVARVGPNEVRKAVSDYWAGSLQKQFAGTLSQNLQSLVAPSSIVPYPWYAGSPPDVAVEVDVLELERGPDGQWRANAWVKAGILLGFRLGRLEPAATGGPFPFYDKDTFPLRRTTLDDGVRIVPGGSAIRDGCYVASGVVCMPPMYINVGAYVGEGTMVDSHALVGSCAQVGRRVHLSAAAQIGGVLEPAGALPVIIEDEVLVGGNCGVYEGRPGGAIADDDLKDVARDSGGMEAGGLLKCMTRRLLSS